MNSWSINWDLSIPPNQAIELLRNIILTPEEGFLASKKYKGNISEDCFELIIKRSIVWGAAIRKEIYGVGKISEKNFGSNISAQFEICSPYKYVNLNSKKLSFLIPIFILSWIGLILVNTFFKNLDYLTYFLIPTFCIPCLILIVGFFKYYFIVDKFDDLKKSFNKLFFNYKITES